MILGTHQLKGKIEILDEPFCIMEKQTKGDGINDADAVMDDVEADELLLSSSSSSKTSYNIVGIIRRKFLFNQYPKTIMRWKQIHKTKQYKLNGF